MKFTLRSLGRLREATIDLSKDLIVLTGPNNTSKTYVAHAVYGFFETYLPKIQRAIQQRLVVRTASQEGGIEIDLCASVLDRFDEIISDISNQYQQMLPRILACETSFTSSTQVLLDFSEKERLEARQQLINWASDGTKVFRGSGIALIKHSGDSTLRVRRISERLTSSLRVDDINDFGIYASVAISAELVEPLFRALSWPRILVAERAAIQLFSKELSQRKTELVYELLDARAEEQSETDLLEKRAKRYSMPIRDALETAQDLAALKRKHSEFAPFADDLEKQLLEGALRVSDDGEMTFQPAGMHGNLEMHLSSSSVKALAPLVFYLRHVAQKGHFLIIDEPELNLHPDNQRKVARLLGRLARTGIKVMISTHSDYVIREINNLIMLDTDVQGNLRRKYGYRDDEILSPGNVGAYIFDAHVAHEISVKPTGIEVETIDREINQLNQVSQDLFFSLFPDAP